MAPDKSNWLPGQTKELPEAAADTEALKTFYSTLYEQRPGSEMAARFLLQHGLLEHDDAVRLNKKLGKGTAAKSGSSSSKPAAKKTGDFQKAKPKAKPAPKKKAAKDDSSDDDSSEFEEKAKKPPPKKPAPKAAKRPAPEDDSSEDDVPLSKR